MSTSNYSSHFNYNFRQLHRTYFPYTWITQVPIHEPLPNRNTHHNTSSKQLPHPFAMPLYRHLDPIPPLLFAPTLVIPIANIN